MYGFTSNKVISYLYLNVYSPKNATEKVNIQYILVQISLSLYLL